MVDVCGGGRIPKVASSRVCRGEGTAQTQFEEKIGTSKRI